MFEVIRLILSGGDNEVDGNDAGDSDNADDDVGDSDKNVLVIVAMTTMKTMKTMIVTMAMVIAAVTECLLKAIMTTMVMVPAPENDDDDGSGIENVYGVDCGCVGGFEEDAYQYGVLHRGEGDEWQ